MTLYRPGEYQVLELNRILDKCVYMDLKSVIGCVFVSAFANCKELEWRT